jgi:hypothetical protein
MSWSGGCINGIRFADEGGSPTRAWIVAADTDADDQPNNKVIIIDVAVDSDDMCAIDGDFYLEWQNKTDASGWNDLSSTGELRWGNVSDYANNDTLAIADFNGTENCSTMGVTATTEPNTEKESANLVQLTSIGSKDLINFCWAVDLNFATAAKDYEFRISQNGGGSGVFKTFTAVVKVVAAGKIDVVSRNKDSSATVGSVLVTAMLSDGGTPPKPVVGEKVVAQGTTNGSGVLSLTGLVSGFKYFLHYYKDDTADLADGTIEITAVAA